MFDQKKTSLAIYTYMVILVSVYTRAGLGHQVMLADYWATNWIGLINIIPLRTITRLLFNYDAITHQL